MTYKKLFSNHINDIDLYDDELNYNKFDFENNLENKDECVLKDLSYHSDYNDDLQLLEDDESIDYKIETYYENKNNVFQNIPREDYNINVRRKYIVPFSHMGTVKFNIPRDQFDVINNIYIEFKLDDGLSFDDVSIQDKMILLYKCSIQLIIENQYIISSTLAGLLFKCYAYGLKIKSDDTILQIPIITFNEMHSQSSKYHSLRSDELGLFIAPLEHHQVYLSFMTYGMENFNISLICNGKRLSKNKRHEIMNISHEYLVIQQEIAWSNTFPATITEQHRIISTRTKLIIINFAPICNNILEHPIIKSITVRAGDNNTYDSFHEIYYMSDLLHMEQLDTHFYIIPFCNEFKSWEKIKKAFECPNKYMTIEHLEYCDIVLEFEYEKELTEIFYVNINTISINIFCEMGGLGGYRISN